MPSVDSYTKAKQMGADYIKRVVSEETPLDPRTVENSRHLLDIGTKVVLASAVKGSDTPEVFEFIPNYDGPKDTHWWEVVGFTSDTNRRPLLRKVGTNRFFTPKLTDGILIERSVRAMGDDFQTLFLDEIQGRRNKAMQVIKDMLLEKLPELLDFLKGAKFYSEEGYLTTPSAYLNAAIYNMEVHLLAGLGGDGPVNRMAHRVKVRAEETLKGLDDLTMDITDGKLPPFNLYFGSLEIKRKLPFPNGLTVGDCFIALDPVRTDLFYKVVEIGKFGDFIATLNEIVPVIENGVAVYSIRELDRYELRAKELLILLGRPSQDRSSSSLWVATQELNKVERFSLEELKGKLGKVKERREEQFRLALCRCFVSGLIESEEMKVAQKLAEDQVKLSTK